MVVEIPLRNSKEFALVDSGDLPKVLWTGWYVTEKGYVLCTCGRADGSRPYLHQLIKGKQCDHKNGNKLDCRRKNLRRATRRQNSWNQPKRKTNTSGFVGVHSNTVGKPWRARVRGRNGEKIELGQFDDPIQAAKVYDLEAKRLHGRFAKLNFPMRFPRNA